LERFRIYTGTILQKAINNCNIIFFKQISITIDKKNVINCYLSIYNSRITIIKIKTFSHLITEIDILDYILIVYRNKFIEITIVFQLVNVGYRLILCNNYSNTVSGLLLMIYLLYWKHIHYL